VTDNRETLSNYIITLEKIGPNPRKGGYENSVPTIAVHHLSQSLSYPPSLFVVDYENFPSSQSFSLLTKELPCDTHLINLRTISEDKVFDIDANIPSNKALTIVQRLGYYCLPENGNNAANRGCGNGNEGKRSLFFPGTTFNQVSIKKLTQTSLTGIDNTTFKEIESFSDLIASPFEIKSLILKF